MKKDKKDNVIVIRVSKNEYNLIKDYAIKNGDIPLSVLLRMSIIKYIQNEKNAVKTQKNAFGGNLQ